MYEKKPVSMETSVTPKRFKTFLYQSDIVWTKDKSGTLSVEDGRSLRVSAPPEFKGEPGLWTPEDFFLASVSVCLMTTFMSLASRAKLTVRSYRDSSEGMLEFAGSRYQFTRIILKPEIEVGSDEEIAGAEEVIRQAHEHCLSANSIKSEVEVRAGVRSQRPKE